MIAEPAILERVIKPKRSDLAPDVAKYIMTFGFPPADLARYRRLSAEAEAGDLTREEQTRLDDYLSINTFLTIVQSKARASLRRRGLTP